MSSLTRTLTVAAGLDIVAAYLGDLANSVEWDPHTVSCRRVDDDGPVQVGTRYAHVRTFHGYEVSIDAEVVAYEPGALVAWSGGHPLAGGREQFRFRASPGQGTEVEHTVDVTLSGVARIGERMVPGIMRRIADDGTETLRACLERLS